ncbi:hypothetical protein LN650_14885 [Klebsiella pneumoniae subsp. pneumoniae]|nr:hypothetical protein [Klebsiella pneumoniae subsp. pneumoniae]
MPVCVKGSNDSALYGWMSDNGDPDNFAGTLLSCDNIQTGSNAARWCDKSYDALVKKALLVSDPQARAKLYEQAQEIFISRRHGSPWRPGKPSMRRAATSVATPSA